MAADSVFNRRCGLMCIQRWPRSKLLTALLAGRRMFAQLIPRSVIQLALAWDGKAALLGRLFHIGKGMAVFDKRTPARKTAVYTHGAASVEAQSAYHRALKTIYGDRLESRRGFHLPPTTQTLAHRERHGTSYFEGSADESVLSCFVRSLFNSTRQERRRNSSALPIAPPPSAEAKAHCASRYCSYALLDAMSFAFASLMNLASSSHFDSAAIACSSARLSAALLT